MATHHGLEGVVAVGVNEVAEVTEFSVTERIATTADSAKGDTWETHLTGLKSWDGTLTCHWDETDTNGQLAMTNGASVTLNLLPEGNTSGDVELTGTATIEEISISSPLEGTVTATFTFKGNGALTHGTV